MASLLDQHAALKAQRVAQSTTPKAQKTQDKSQYLQTDWTSINVTRDQIADGDGIRLPGYDYNTKTGQYSYNEQAEHRFGSPYANTTLDAFEVRHDEKALETDPAQILRDSAKMAKQKLAIAKETGRAFGTIQDEEVYARGDATANALWEQITKGGTANEDGSFAVQYRDQGRGFYGRPLTELRNASDETSINQALNTREHNADYNSRYNKAARKADLEQRIATYDQTHSTAGNTTTETTVADVASSFYAGAVSTVGTVAQFLAVDTVKFAATLGSSKTQNILTKIKQGQDLTQEEEYHRHTIEFLTQKDTIESLDEYGDTVARVFRQGAEWAKTDSAAEKQEVLMQQLGKSFDDGRFMKSFVGDLAQNPVATMAYLAESIPFMYAAASKATRIPFAAAFTAENYRAGEALYRDTYGEDPDDIDKGLILLGSAFIAAMNSAAAGYVTGKGGDLANHMGGRLMKTLVSEYLGKVATKVGGTLTNQGANKFAAFLLKSGKTVLQPAINLSLKGGTEFLQEGSETLITAASVSPEKLSISAENFGFKTATVRESAQAAAIGFGSGASIGGTTDAVGYLAKSAAARAAQAQQDQEERDANGVIRNRTQEIRDLPGYNQDMEFLTEFEGRIIPQGENYDPLSAARADPDFNDIGSIRENIGHIKNAIRIAISIPPGEITDGSNGSQYITLVKEQQEKLAAYNARIQQIAQENIEQVIADASTPVADQQRQTANIVNDVYFGSDAPPIDLDTTAALKAQFDSIKHLFTPEQQAELEPIFTNADNVKQAQDTVLNTDAPTSRQGKTADQVHEEIINGSTKPDGSVNNRGGATYRNSLLAKIQSGDVTAYEKEVNHLLNFIASQQSKLPDGHPARGDNDVVHEDRSKNYFRKYEAIIVAETLYLQAIHKEVTDAAARAEGRTDVTTPIVEDADGINDGQVPPVDSYQDDIDQQGDDTGFDTSDTGFQDDNENPAPRTTDTGPTVEPGSVEPDITTEDSSDPDLSGVEEESSTESTAETAEEEPSAPLSEEQAALEKEWNDAFNEYLSGGGEGVSPEPPELLDVSGKEQDALEKEWTDAFGDFSINDAALQDSTAEASVVGEESTAQSAVDEAPAVEAESNSTAEDTKVLSEEDAPAADADVNLVSESGNPNLEGNADIQDASTNQSAERQQSLANDSGGKLEETKNKALAQIDALKEHEAQDTSKLSEEALEIHNQKTASFKKLIVGFREVYRKLKKKLDATAESFDDNAKDIRHLSVMFKNSVADLASTLLLRNGVFGGANTADFNKFLAQVNETNPEVDTTAGTESHKALKQIYFRYGKFKKQFDKGSVLLRDSASQEDIFGSTYAANLALGLAVKNDKGELEFRPEVIAAMSLASALWLKEEAYKTLNIDKRALSKWFNVQEDLIDFHQVAEFAEKGLPRKLVAASVGRRVYQTLGITTQEDAETGAEERLITALGLMTLDTMDRMGEIDVTSESTKTINDLFFGNKRIGQSASAKAATTDTGSTVVTVRVKSELNEDGWPILDSKLTTGNGPTVPHTNQPKLAADVFGISRDPNEPIEEPSKHVQYGVKKDETELTKEQQDDMTAAQQVAHHNASAVTDLITSMGKDFVKKLLGFVENAEEVTHIDDIKSVLSKNKEITTSIDHLLNNVEGFENRPFYFEMVVHAGNRRRYYKTSTFDPQSDTLHRFTVSLDDSKTTPVNLTLDTADVAFLPFVVMMTTGLGLADEKAPVSEHITEFDKLTKPENLAKISKALKEQDEAAILEILGDDAGGHSLATLVELNRYHEAKQSGAEEYKPQLLMETDGVTNGAAIGFMQLAGAFANPAIGTDNLWRWLARMGIYEKGKYKGYQDWKNTSVDGHLNDDSYQHMARTTVKKLSDQLAEFKTEGKTVRANAQEAMERILGSFIDEDNGNITQAARKLMKYPFMIHNYGASTRKIIEQIAAEVTDSARKQITEAVAKGDQAALTQLENDLRAIHANNSYNGNRSVPKLLLSTALDTSLRDLRFDMTKSLVTVLKAPVTEALNDELGDFINMRKVMNDAFRIQFEAFDIAYKKQIEELAKENTLEGVKITEAQARQALTHVAYLLPGFLGAMKNDSAKNRIPVLKTATVYEEGDLDKIVQIYTKEANSVGVKTSSSTTAKRIFIDGGVSGVIFAIHSLDATVQQRALALMRKRHGTDVLNVFDAGLTDVNSSPTYAKIYNEVFIETMRDYSVFSDLQAMMSGIEDSPELQERINQLTEFDEETEGDVQKYESFAAFSEMLQGMKDDNEHAKDDLFSNELIVEQMVHPAGDSQFNYDPKSQKNSISFRSRSKSRRITNQETNDATEANNEGTDTQETTNQDQEAKTDRAKSESVPVRVEEQQELIDAAEKQRLKDEDYARRVKVRRTVDIVNDNMLTAIRKLGGINTSNNPDGKLASELREYNRQLKGPLPGLNQPIPGRGLSLHDMFQALEGYGYLELDEDIGNGVNETILEEIILDGSFAEEMSNAASAVRERAERDAIAAYEAHIEEEFVETQLPLTDENDSTIFNSSDRQIDIRNFLAERTETVTSQNVTTIYNSLAHLTPRVPTGEFATHLTNLMSTLIEKGLKPMDDLILKLKSDQAGSFGAIDGHNIYMNINSTRESYAEQTPQEVFVHELLHGISASFINNNVQGRRKIRRLFELAKKEVTYKDFLNYDSNGDVLFTVSREAEIAQAKRTRAHMFALADTKNKAGVVVNNSLHEFFTYAMTNEHMVAKLKTIKSRKTKYNKENNLFESFLSYLEDLMIWISSSMDSTSGPNIQAEINNIAHSIIAVESNSIFKILSAIEKGITMVRKPIDLTTLALVDSLIFVLRSVGGPRDAANLLNAIPNTLRAAGNILAYQREVRLNPDDNVVTTIVKESTNQLLTQFTSEDGVLRKAMNSVITKNSEFAPWLSLLRQSKHSIDQLRKTVSTTIQRDVLKNFTGKLTKNENIAVTKSFLAADIAALEQHSLTDISAMLKDPSRLAKEIAIAKKALVKNLNTKQRDTLTNQATGLASLMVKGTTNTYQQALNVHQLEQKLGKNDLTPQLDEYVSLLALQEVTVDDRKIAATVIDRELATSTDNNGITFLLAQHKSFKKESLKRLFNGNPMQMRKGYMAEIYDHTVDVKVAPISDAAQLMKDGYVLVEELTSDPLTRNAVGKRAKQPMGLYVASSNPITQRVKSIVSVAEKGARGTTLADSNLASGEGFQKVLNALEISKTYQQYQAKESTVGRGNRLVPIYNGAGKIVNYRYVMSEKLRSKYLHKSYDIAEVMGSMHASIESKDNSESINRQVINLAYSDYKENFAKEPEKFVIIDGDPETTNFETYKLLPNDMKAYAKKRFGKNTPIYVRRELVDLIFGYRKVSLANINLIKGTPIAHVVKAIENGWQGIVAQEKVNIVIKTIDVMLNNIISNTITLKVMGIPAKDILSNTLEAVDGMNQYQKDFEELISLQKQLQGDPSKKNDSDFVHRISFLRQEIKLNPVTELVDEGIFQSITEDIDADQYGDKTKLLDWLQNTIGKHTPLFVKKGVEIAYISEDTAAFKFLMKTTQYSDFTARYVMWKHEMAKPNANKEVVLDNIIRTFINYDDPSNKYVQWGNDMGLIMFTKFAIGIQSVVLRMAGKHTANLVTAHIMQEYIHQAADITDSFFLTSDLSSIFHLDLPEHLWNAAAPQGIVLLANLVD